MTPLTKTGLSYIIKKNKCSFFGVAGPLLTETGGPPELSVMRVLERDVDMLSVSYIGKPPQPRKFKIRFRDGSFRTVTVDQIKRVDSVTPAGHPNFVYYCYSEVDDRIVDYELRYFVREMRWELYRVYE